MSKRSIKTLIKWLYGPKVDPNTKKPLCIVQGDHSPCAKPRIDFKTKVPLWPGQVRAGQAKTELLF